MLDLNQSSTFFFFLVYHSTNSHRDFSSTCQTDPAFLENVPAYMSSASFCLNACMHSDSAVFLPRSMMPVPFHHLLLLLSSLSAFSSLYPVYASRMCPVILAACPCLYHTWWNSWPTKSSYQTRLVLKRFYRIYLWFTIHLILNGPKL